MTSSQIYSQASLQAKNSSHHAHFLQFISIKKLNHVSKKVVSKAVGVKLKGGSFLKNVTQRSAFPPPELRELRIMKIDCKPRRELIQLELSARYPRLISNLFWTETSWFLVETKYLKAAATFQIPPFFHPFALSQTISKCRKVALYEIFSNFDSPIKPISRRSSRRETSSMVKNVLLTFWYGS